MASVWQLVAVFVAVAASATAAVPSDVAIAAQVFGAAAETAGWLDHFELIKYPIIGDGVWYLHADVLDALGWDEPELRPNRVKELQGRHTPNLKWAITHYGDGVVDADEVLVFVDNSAILYWHEVVLVTPTHVTHRSHVCGSHAWSLHVADTRGVLPRLASYACRRFDAPYGVPSHRHFCGGNPDKQPRQAGNRTWSVMPTLCSPSVDLLASALDAYIGAMRKAVMPRREQQRAAGLSAALHLLDAASPSTHAAGVSTDEGNVEAAAVRSDDACATAVAALTRAVQDSAAVTSLDSFTYAVAPGLSSGSTPGQSYQAALRSEKPSTAVVMDAPLRALAAQSFAWLHAAKNADGCGEAVRAAVGAHCLASGMLNDASVLAPARALSLFERDAQTIIAGGVVDNPKSLKKWFKLFRTSPSRCNVRGLQTKLRSLLHKFVPDHADATRSSAPSGVSLACTDAEHFRVQVILAAGFELLVGRGCADASRGSGRAVRGNRVVGDDEVDRTAAHVTPPPVVDTRDDEAAGGQEHADTVPAHVEL